jgi:response regulator RpfG family c-di-GMP phosphodiesterase
MTSEKILFVDDEPAALDGYRRLLHRTFQVDTAVGAAEGLAKIAESGPYAVVVSDMRMPEMDGATFLAMVNNVAHDTVRMAITGYADMETAGRAVNEGSIFRFLTKPCEKDTLTASLTAALEQHRLINAEKELLEKTLSGSIHVLTSMLSLVNPAAFSRIPGIQRCVSHLVKKLELTETWRFDVAASLALLGCVTLDTDLIEAFFAGQKLSAEDQKRFDSHPKVAANLLANIPRLEAVSWMIANQQSTVADLHDTVPRQPRDIILGASILSVSVAYDRLICQGCSHEEAVHQLRLKKQLYDESVVDSLEQMKATHETVEIRTCPIPELRAGMVLREEVRTHGGLLVVAKGQEISSALLLRLGNFYERKQISGSVLVLMHSHPATVGV